MLRASQSWLSVLFYLAHIELKKRISCQHSRGARFNIKTWLSSFSSKVRRFDALAPCPRRQQLAGAVQPLSPPGRPSTPSPSTHVERNPPGPAGWSLRPLRRPARSPQHCVNYLETRGRCSSGCLCARFQPLAQGTGVSTQSSRGPLCPALGQGLLLLCMS